jgi:nucleoside-diphosphate-sugar epimerase
LEIEAEDVVVVTGGSGFVGAALTRRLLDHGATVRVISRFAESPARQALEAGARSAGRLEWFCGDIADAASVRAAFHGARTVFHAAALVNSHAPRAVFDRANVQATETVCALSLEAGAGKLVHVSTCDVFGLPRGKEIITEETPYRRWREPYADSKIRAAEIVKAFRARGLVTSIVYPGWVYGPGDRNFVPALRRQLESGLMPLWGPAGFELHLVFVEDLVDGLIAAAGEAADNDDFLMLDESSGVEMGDLCGHIAAHFKLTYRALKVPYAAMHAAAWLSQHVARLGFSDKPLLTTTDVKSFGYRFRYSAAKARRVLGWAPRTPVRAGLSAALDWCAAHVGPARERAHGAQRGDQRCT